MLYQISREWLSAGVLMLALFGCVTPEPAEMAASGTASRRPSMPAAQRTSPREASLRSPSLVGNGFRIAVDPQSVYLERGKAISVQISVTRAAGFRDAITITVANLPSKVNTNAPLIIPASATVGTLTLSATQGTPFAERLLIVTGSGQAGGEMARHTQALPLMVSRQLGPFHETVPDFRAVGQARRSPNGRFSVRVSSGAEAGVESQLTASFENASGRPKIQPVGFYADRGTKLGGIGFCSASQAAVVLSANASDIDLGGAHVLTFVSMNQAAPPRQMEVHAAGDTAIFPPRIFFSPDCTVALVTGFSNSRSSQQMLSVIDLITGDLLGKPAAIRSLVFSASTVLRNQQPVVEVRADGRVSRYPLTIE